MTSACRQLGTGPADHERLEPLAELLVGDADHGRLDDVGMAGEQVLDLGGEHVLAARHDHVVVAAVDEQPALGVEVAEVTARQQAVDLLLVATAGVAVEAGAAADEDPPDDARSATSWPCVVEDAHRAAAARRGQPSTAPPGRSPGPAIVASETSVEP